MSTSLGSKILFKKLCALFENLHKTKGVERQGHLQKFTREVRDEARKLKAQDPSADISLFPIFRLILPSLDRERGPYGMKTKNLSSIYLQIFYINKEKLNAHKFADHRFLQGSSKNDFADRITLLAKTQLQKKSTVTIQGVNEFLDNVANCDESNKKKQLFLYLRNNFTDVEFKWLTRILLKDLKLNLTKSKVFEVIHPQAEELFKVSDLFNVCSQYSDLQSETANEPVRIEVFSFIKPMLLEKLEVQNFSKLFDEKQYYYVQPKFDGERSQIHMRDGRFKYFTRQGFDITNNASYGEFSNSGGFLTSNIASLLNKDCKSIILDGELMGWHKIRKKFGSQGQSFDVKKLTVTSHHQPCFVAFDILLYNDKVLINKPYSERLKYLNEAFTEREGVLCKSEITKVSNVEDILVLFNKSLDKNEEGIVIKECDVTYKPQSRIKSGCYKVKAEYSKDLVTDLDLIILGGYYGEGRCSGILSSFLVGVASPPTNKNMMPSEFSALGGVRSGLSDDDLEKIQQKLRPYWQDAKPYGVSGPRTKASIPNLWIAPKHSLVLKLRASELVSSTTYPLGYTLRFPRVMDIRYDKSWYDTCCTTELMTLVKDKAPVQKLTKRKATVADIYKADDGSDEEKPKIRKTTAATVYDDIGSIKNLEVTRLSRVFQGKEICVLNGDDELDTLEITKILLRHSADVKKHPGSNTFCVIVGNPNVQRAINAIESNKHDIVKVSWLKRATQPENLNKIQKFYPWEMWAKRPSTERKLDEIYDDFHDSYEQDATEESLKRSLQRADEMFLEAQSQSMEKVKVSEMKKLDDILFGGCSTHGVFRGIVGYFPDQNDVEILAFEYMAGIVSKNLDENVDYVFINDKVSETVLQQLKQSKVKIVNSKWIGECFKNQKFISEKLFTI